MTPASLHMLRIPVYVFRICTVSMSLVQVFVPKIAHVKKKSDFCDVRTTRYLFILT